MPGHSNAIATPHGSWSSTAFVGVLPLLVFLTNKATYTCSSFFVDVLTSKETRTGSSGFIGSHHHPSNAYRSSPVFVFLPLLVFLTNKATMTLHDLLD